MESTPCDLLATSLESTSRALLWVQHTLYFYCRHGSGSFVLSCHTVHAHKTTCQSPGADMSANTSRVQVSTHRNKE